MPKKKTSKTAAKRLKKTGGGKIVFRKPGKGHLLSSKSAGRKRRMRKVGVLCAGDFKRLGKMLD